jgi:vancomycin resistance protein YoaR
VPLGGLTQSEAIDLIRSQDPDKLVPVPRALMYGSKKFEYLPYEVGAIAMIEESVQRVWRLSHQGGFWAQLWFRLSGEKRSFPYDIRLVNDQKLIDFIEIIAKKIEHPPVSAKFEVADQKVYSAIKKANLQFRVGAGGPAGTFGGLKSAAVPELPGVNVDIPETARLLEKSINKGLGTSPLIVHLEEPRITLKNLPKIPNPHLLGEYTTYFGTHDSPNRIHNVHLVAAKIHETILAPEETFSLLSKTGKFTEDEGYKEAFVITGGALVPQYGGGACQIGTTLYNTVQYADLEVLSRQNHNIYFSIYPLGRDATIYPPVPDFQFKNNTGAEVIIYAEATPKYLNFKLFGTNTGKTVSFLDSTMRFHPKYQTVTAEVDGKIVEAQVKIAPVPFSASSTRIVSQEGKTIKTETVHSYYMAHGDKDRVKIIRREPR